MEREQCGPKGRYHVIGGVAELFAHELILPVGRFVLVVRHQAGYYERHVGSCVFAEYLFKE